MSKALITISALIALAIPGYFCIYHHSVNIQNDIYYRTSAAISAPDLDKVTVDADGRDIVLTGMVASAALRQQAEELAIKVHGVRTVDNQLAIADHESDASRVKNRSTAFNIKRLSQ